ATTEIAELAENVTDAAPAPRRGPPPLPRRLEEEEELRDGPVTVCPRCGEPTPADAERCRHCRARLDAPPQKRRPGHDSRPRGAAPDRDWVPGRVGGSFAGPALFNPARGGECGYAYNGLSGKSNLPPAILFITIPLVLIVGIVIFIIVLLINR